MATNCAAAHENNLCSVERRSVLSCSSGSGNVKSVCCTNSSNVDNPGGDSMEQSGYCHIVSSSSRNPPLQVGQKNIRERIRTRGSNGGRCKCIDLSGSSSNREGTADGDDSGDGEAEKGLPGGGGELQPRKQRRCGVANRMEGGGRWTPKTRGKKTSKKQCRNGGRKKTTSSSSGGTSTSRNAKKSKGIDCNSVVDGDDHTGHPRSRRASSLQLRPSPCSQKVLTGSCTEEGRTVLPCNGRALSSSGVIMSSTGTSSWKNQLIQRNTSTETATGRGSRCDKRGYMGDTGCNSSSSSSLLWRRLGGHDAGEGEDGNSADGQRRRPQENQRKRRKQQELRCEELQAENEEPEGQRGICQALEERYGRDIQQDKPRRRRQELLENQRERRDDLQEERREIHQEPGEQGERGERKEEEAEPPTQEVEEHEQMRCQQHEMQEQENLLRQQRMLQECQVWRALLVALLDQQRSELYHELHGSAEEHSPGGEKTTDLSTAAVLLSAAAGVVPGGDQFCRPPGADYNHVSAGPSVVPPAPPTPNSISCEARDSIGAAVSFSLACLLSFMWRTGGVRRRAPPSGTTVRCAFCGGPCYRSIPDAAGRGDGPRAAASRYFPSPAAATADVRGTAAAWAAALPATVAGAAARNIRPLAAAAAALAAGTHGTSQQVHEHQWLLQLAAQEADLSEIEEMPREGARTQQLLQQLQQYVLHMRQRSQGENWHQTSLRLLRSVTAAPTCVPEKESSLFIFDLDDTLIPTEWIRSAYELRKRETDGDYALDIYQEVSRELNQMTGFLLIPLILRTILKAKAWSSTVAIVTNARSSKWLSIVDFMFPELSMLLRSEGIPIIRSCPVGEEPSSVYLAAYFAYWMNAKKSKFEELILHHFERHPNALSKRLDIISVGDTDFEEYAATVRHIRIGWSYYRRCLRD